MSFFRKTSKILISIWILILIRFKYRKFFKIVNELMLLAERMIERICWNDSQLNFYCVVQISQNIHRLKSIYTLVSHGLTTDAWPIFRSEIESILDYNYIIKNPEKLDLYFHYSIYLDIRNLKRKKLTGKFSDSENELLKNLQMQWEKYSRDFETKEGRIRNVWRDKKLSELAKYAKMEEIYSIGYSHASDYSHGNSNLIREFVLGRDNRGLILRGGENITPNDILILLSLSANLFLYQLLVTNNKYKTRFEREINDKLAFFKNLAK